MSVVPPDYDADPERWSAWRAPVDVHDVVAAEVRGLLLDVGCGEGRLMSALPDGVRSVGIDSSPSQVGANPHRPVVIGDMRALPFCDGTFAEVVHLWCLYHLDDPRSAIAEARRVLRASGCYFACTAARDNDPELVPDGYPSTPFDAEEAAAIVASVFDEVEAEHWNGVFVTLESREELRAYCRHHSIPMERADAVDLPLELTKRGVLIRARKR